MVVKNKQTGQYGTLPDNEFDPNVYEAVSAPAQKTAPVQPQPQAPDPLSMQDGTPPVQQPSLAENIGKAGMSLVGSIANPVIGLYNKAVSTTEGNEKKKGTLDIVDAVKDTAEVATSPEAGKAAAMTASLAVPYGKAGFIGSKFVAPGAAQGGLMGLAEGDNPEELLGDVALGAGAGVATKAVSAGLPAVTKASKDLLTQGADDASKTMALKGLKPSPSQQARFYKETGEKLDDFLVSRNLGGADSNTIDNAIMPIQEQFDQVANNADLVIDGKSLIGKFDDEIKRLGGSILPADQTKAKTLQSIRDNFIAKYGNEQMGADVLTALRKDVDAGIRDYALDPAVKSPLNLTRDILQGAIRESADTAGVTVQGKSLKEIGVELSKMYKLQEIAERQQFNGQSTLPLGLTNLLGATAGGAAGGPLGIIAGAATTATMNSPKTSNLASKVLGGISDKAEGLPVVPPFNAAANNIAGQATTRTAIGAGSGVPSSDDNSDYNRDQLHTTTDSITTEPESQVSYVTGNSPEAHAQAYIAALQAGDKASATQIKGLYDMEVKYQESSNKTEKPLPVAAQNQVNLAKSGSRGLEEAYLIYQEDPSVLAKQLVPGQWVSRKFDSAMFKTVEALLRARSGAAVPESEVRRYLTKYGAVFGDSPEVVEFKFDQLRQDFRDVLEGAGKTAGSTTPEQGLDINNATLQQY